MPSIKEASIEIDKAYQAVISKTVSLPSPPSKDPFIEDTDAMPKLRTPFEQELHRVSEPTSMSSSSPTEEQRSPLLEENDASYGEQTSSESPLQVPNLPSPPKTALKAVSMNQMASTPESPELSSIESMGQMAKPQSPKKIKRSSNASCKRPVKFPESAFDADVQEQITLEAFSFNDIPRGRTFTSDSMTSAQAPTPTPIKVANIAAEFGGRENSTRLFTFQLPTSQSSLGSAGSPLAGGSVATDLTNFAIDFSRKESNVRPSAFTEVPTSSPTAATQRERSIQNVDHASAPGESFPESPTHASSQQSDPGPDRYTPSVSTSPPVCLPSIKKSSEGTPLIFSHPPNSEIWNPIASPDLSEQKPLPSFNFGFIPQYPNLRPRTKGAPSTRTKSPAKPTDDGSGFVFGLEYKAPPKSFDFNTWSKLSSAARLPSKIAILDALGTQSSKTSQEEITQRVDQRIVDPTRNETEEADDELCRELSIKISPTTLAEYSTAQTAPSESASASPKTPIKTSSATRNDELLTPEASPEPTRVSLEFEEDSEIYEIISDLLQAQGQGLSTSVKENKNLTPDAPSDPDPIHVATAGGVCGHAIITDQQRYQTLLSTKQASSFLTPPATPETSHSREPVEGRESNEPQSRPSAVIIRKPLPNSKQTPSASQETETCANCGQVPSPVEEGCRCGSREQIDWEITPSRARGRGVRRRLRRTAARAANEFKTTAEKVAHSLGSLATRLESDGVDQDFK